MRLLLSGVVRDARYWAAIGERLWALERPGGRVVFRVNHPLMLLCSPLYGASCDTTLHRPCRAMWRAAWTGVAFEPSGSYFNLTAGDWFAMVARIGFKVQHYQELHAPDRVIGTGTRTAEPANFAKSYPVKQVWFLEKSA